MTASVAVRLSRSSPIAGALALALVLGAAIARGGLPSLFLLVVVVGTCLAVLFAQLRLAALTAWIVLSPLAYPFARYPTEHALFTFDRVWIGALASVVLLSHRGDRGAAASRRFLICLVWLAVAFGVRAATSAAPLSSLETWIDAILLPTLLFAAAREVVESEQDVRHVTGALAACGLALAGIGIVGRVAGADLASLTGGGLRIDELGLLRISGPYPAPEPFALALLVCLAATLYWAMSRHGGTRAIGVLVACVEIAAIGLTLFRVAWIAAALVVAASLGLRPRRPGRVIAVVAIVAVLLFGGAAALRHNTTLAARIDNTANIDGRLATYLTGLQIFEQAPTFGVGVNGFTEAQRHYAERVGGVQAVPSPHSSYIGLLAEQGIVGFLPLVAATAAGFLLLRRLRQLASRQADVLLAATGAGAALAYLAMSLSLTMLPYGPSNALFALFLGVVAARTDSLDETRQDVRLYGR